MTTLVPFLNLKAQYRQIKSDVDAAVLRAIESTQYVLGPEVVAFEKRFAEYCTVGHCLAVNSGTSALHLDYASPDLGNDRGKRSPDDLFDADPQGSTNFQAFAIGLCRDHPVWRLFERCRPH